MDEIGREIGHAKHRGLETYGTTKTFDAQAKVRAYFAKMRDIIESNKHAKIRDKDGNELGLHIHVTSTGTLGKKNYKVDLGDVKFRKIQRPGVSKNPVIPSPITHKAA